MYLLSLHTICLLGILPKVYQLNCGPLDHPPSIQTLQKASYMCLEPPIQRRAENPRVWGRSFLSQNSWKIPDPSHPSGRPFSVRTPRPASDFSSPFFFILHHPNHFHPFTTYLPNTPYTSPIHFLPPISGNLFTSSFKSLRVLRSWELRGKIEFGEEEKGTRGLATHLELLKGCWPSSY